MIGQVYFRPAIPLLISLMTGIAIGSWIPGHGFLAYLIIFSCAGLLFYLIIKNKSDSISPLILFAALGYLSIQPWVLPKFSADHIINFAGAKKYKIIGTIDSIPSEYNNRIKLILKTITLEEENKSCFVKGKLRVTVAGKSFFPAKGDRVSLTGRIKLIRNFNNPGAFDYKRYMAFKGIFATSYVSGKKLVLLKKGSERGLCKSVEDTRDKIRRLIDNTKGKDQKSVLKALIIGEKNSVSQYLRNAFNRAGVGHLLAISGLHIGIIASVAFIFFLWILSYIKYFLWYAWAKKGAAILTLMPVMAYGLISGMSPSTQRAVIMIAVFLAAFIFEKQHDPINTLALAAMIILIIFPPSLFSISFQLSFAAAFSIIYGLSKTYNRIYNQPNRQTDNRAVSKKKGIKQGWGFLIQKKLFTFLLVSLFAILGTLPIVAFYFNQVSLVGMAANFIIIPLIGFIVVPLGLFSAFLSLISFSAALLFMNVSAIVLTYAIDIVYFISDFQFAACKIVTPTYFEICCYYLLVYAVLNIITAEKKALSNKEHGSVRGQSDAPLFIRLKEKILTRRKIAGIIFVVVLLAGIIDVFYWINLRFRNDDLKVTIIDVGQGSCGLLEFPKGFIMLIDGGGFSDNSIFDVGARIVAPFLWRKKIKTIDTIILSHPNSDHLNGLLYIAEHFNVKNIWTNGEPADTLGYKKFINIIKDKKIHTPEFKNMSRVYNINGAYIKILYPEYDFFDKIKKDKWRNSNNNSIVLKVEFGTKSFLFPGDIMARAEKELAAVSGDELKSVVLIAPHHGSKSSSTNRFLEKVKPEFAVISSGFRNRFKFPHPSVLKAYKNKGYRVYCTADSGALTMTTDGDSLSITTYIQAPDNT